MSALIETFHLEQGGVVCFVGAGGKTNLMFNTAYELAQKGIKVLTTTTTKIHYPSIEQSDCVLISNCPEEILEKAEKCDETAYHLTAAACYHEKESKLIGFERQEIDRLWESRLFNSILIEADGAKGKSLKVPAAHEPVLPVCTTMVVAVAGLDAIGKPLNDENVFRPELYSKVTGLELNESITEKYLVDSLIAVDGVFKDCPPQAEQYVFLNKAETNEKLNSGRKCISLLLAKKRTKIKKIVLGTAKNSPYIIESYNIK